MSRRVATLAVLLAGCHPRGPAKAEERPDPAPMCAAPGVIRDRVEGATLVVEVHQTEICEPAGPPTVVELARAALEMNPSCPAGKVHLEVGGGERIRLPDYAARLDRRTTSELASALTSFTAANGSSSGTAYVVSCTDPTWLLVAHRDGSPRARLYAVPPPDANPPPEPAPTGPSVATPPRDELVTGTCTESLAVGADVWVGRTLTTGLLPGPSHLTTWTLGRTGNTATLVIQERRATKQSGRPTDAQPEGTWACVRSIAWTGSVQGSMRSAPLQLTLSQGARGQQLELTCSTRTIAAADAAARRIRVPSSEEGCNASRWAPATRRQVQVLACVNAADGPDPAPVFLAARPGVEHVTYDNDDCGDRAEALRRIPRDGGIAPAMKISEQPATHVPAHLRSR